MFKYLFVESVFMTIVILMGIIGCSMIAFASMHYILSMLSVHFLVNYTVLKLRGLAVTVL